MYASDKVKSYHYVRNCDVKLHSREEMEQLLKKGIIEEDTIKANEKLA